jgi:hypothetical protein
MLRTSRATCMAIALVKSDMALTKRQETAGVIAAELKRLGAFVVNALPLNEDQKLIFQILDNDREAILAKLSEWQWTPVLRNYGLRFHRDMALPCCTYEIAIEHDRQPVADDRRTIRGEIAEKMSTPEEVAAVRRHLGLDVK